MKVVKLMKILKIQANLEYYNCIVIIGKNGLNLCLIYFKTIIIINLKITTQMANCMNFIIFSMKKLIILIDKCKWILKMKIKNFLNIKIIILQKKMILIF